MLFLPPARAGSHIHHSASPTHARGQRINGTCDHGQTGLNARRHPVIVGVDDRAHLQRGYAVDLHRPGIDPFRLQFRQAVQIHDIQAFNFDNGDINIYENFRCQTTRARAVEIPALATGPQLCRDATSDLLGFLPALTRCVRKFTASQVHDAGSGYQTRVAKLHRGGAVCSPETP